MNSEASVLMTEVQPATATSLRDDLCSLGYEVTCLASSREEALRAIETGPQGLTLLGLHFPKREDVAIAGGAGSYLNVSKMSSPLSSAGEILGPVSSPSDESLRLSTNRAFIAQSTAVLSAMQLNERQGFRWLSTAVDSAADGIVIVDPNGTIRFLNLVAERLIGLSLEQAFGQHFAQVLLFEHRGRRITDDLVRLATLNEEPLSLGKELVLISRDGRSLQVDAEISVASGSPGASGSAVFTLRDITQRKWEEHQHRQEHAIRAVERLAEATSHALNDLLTAILGNSELLLSSPNLSEEQRDSGIQVKSAALEAATVVRRLSAISRTKFVVRQQLNVNSIIQEFLPVLLRSIPREVRLTTKLDSSARNVRADRSQLEQVLFHLVANAVDAISPAGEIVIATENLTIEPADRYQGEQNFVSVKVRDTGEGMTRETVERIFEPFFTLRKERGKLGLGLCIAQGIICDYRGFLVVKSELGGGTEFTFSLPGMEADPFAYLDESGVGTALREAKSIFVVEDDAAVRALLRKVLERQQYEVVEAQDAEDALMAAQLHESRIDLLITDVAMPGISGLDLVRKFAPLHPETKFLCISGSSIDRIGNAASLPRGVEFLPKPFTQKSLLAQIRNLLAESVM